MNALENLARDCSQYGSPVKAKTLYDYVRRIKVLLEEPLQAFAGKDEETIRSQRTVLMEKLFAVPSSFARAAASTSKPLEALEIACEKRAAAKGKSFTYPDYKIAIEHLKKSAGDTGDYDDTEQNGGTDFGDSAGGDATATERQRIVEKAQKSSSLEQVFSSQINSEARRIRIDPEQVKGLYVSFLQTMLSTIQDMGVEK